LGEEKYMRKPLLKANRKRRNKRAPSMPSPDGARLDRAGGVFATSTGGKRRNTKVPDLPPNERLQKHPDEAYGDTEIPERNEDI
jgi:hypothetical protein